MKKKHKVHHLWLILAAYGVWFAVLSGIEEIFMGKYWKVILGIFFGIIVYLLIENSIDKN